MGRVMWVLAGVCGGLVLGAVAEPSFAQNAAPAPGPTQAAPNVPTPPAPAETVPAQGRWHQFCESTDFRRAHTYATERGQQGFELVTATAVGGRHQVLLCFKKRL